MKNYKHYWPNYSVYHKDWSCKIFFDFLRQKSIKFAWTGELDL